MATKVPASGTGSGTGTVESGPSTPLRRRRAKSQDWEDEVDGGLGPDDSSDKGGSRRGGTRSPLTSRRVHSRTKVQGRASPSAKLVPLRPAASPRQRRAAPPAAPLRAAPPSTTVAAVDKTIRLLYELLLGGIRLAHTILAPVYPYLAALVVLSLGISWGAHALLHVIPPILFRVPGHLLRLVVPSWSTASRLSDTALGQNLALLPLNSLATPVCALTGSLCQLSLLGSVSGPHSGIARPFWQWGQRRDQVDIGSVARSLAKEAKGAKDIFESISLLSEGGMMDRLEYVRIWELGAAIQVGSNLDAKGLVTSELYELGNLAKDLSDELVGTNAMAIDAFTWLQWEFSSLVKVLFLPGSARPSNQVLSTRLNALLDRLSSALGDLHKMASVAHTLAQRGSTKGQNLRANLNTIGADLRREHDRAPGWRHAVERANHFFVGGDPSRAELISRDLRLTELTITSLSGLVRHLEEARIGIKGFRDQIGFFDASMMGFHLGAGEHVGIGPEDEVRILSSVVDEFGKAVGRAKGTMSGESTKGLDS